MSAFERICKKCGYLAGKEHVCRAVTPPSSVRAAEETRIRKAAAKG